MYPQYRVLCTHTVKSTKAIPRVATDLTIDVVRAAVFHGSEAYILSPIYKAILVLVFTESGLVLKSKETPFLRVANAWLLL